METPPPNPNDGAAPDAAGVLPVVAKLVVPKDGALDEAAEVDATVEPVPALPPNENVGAELAAVVGVAPNPNDPLLAPIPDPRLNPPLDDEEAPPNANEDDDAAEGVELAPNRPPDDDATGVPLAPPNEKPLEPLDDANENPFCASVPGVPDEFPPKENPELLAPPNEDDEPPAGATSSFDHSAKSTRYVAIKSGTLHLKINFSKQMIDMKFNIVHFSLSLGEYSRMIGIQLIHTTYRTKIPTCIATISQI